MDLELLNMRIGEDSSNIGVGTEADNGHLKVSQPVVWELASPARRQSYRRALLSASKEHSSHSGALDGNGRSLFLDPNRINKSIPH